MISLTENNAVIPIGAAVIGQKMMRDPEGNVTHTTTYLLAGKIHTATVPIFPNTKDSLVPAWKLSGVKK